LKVAPQTNVLNKGTGWQMCTDANNVSLTAYGIKLGKIVYSGIVLQNYLNIKSTVTCGAIQIDLLTYLLYR